MTTNKPTAIYYDILKYQPDNLDLLTNKFNLVRLGSPLDDYDEILAQASLCFAPLGYFFDDAKMARCPKLEVIATNTTGVPHIDTTSAERRNIYVASLKDEQEFLATITPTAEHAWGLLLSVLRNMRAATQSVLKGKWDRRPFPAMSMLSRMSIGIIGYGRLGSLVAKYAQAFGMQVSCYDPHVVCKDDFVSQFSSLKELVANNDVISLHAPSLPETRNLISDEIISTFKSGSIFINSARGELVDEKALCAAVRSGRIAGIGIDVLDGEFAPDFDANSHALVDLAKENPNVVITPHIGGSTLNAWAETERRVIDMALSYFQNIQERQMD